MKKIMALVLTAVMALALLAGCGGKTNDNTDNNGGDTANNGGAAAISGTVSTDGSTSMEKVIGALSESTRDGFESITGTKDKCQYRQELTSTGDVITAVSQNPDAIGYASLASIKDSVKALNVDGVTPSEASVKDGSYKVQRPFVLVTVEGKALSPAAQSFFDYVTSADAADIIAKAGAVAAN